jgi:hypothetical protein
MLQRLDTTARPERPVGEPTSRVPFEAPPPERARLELSIPKVLAGALAAASAAVAASWLGVAGTVIGAVIASVVVSITTALYSHPLERGSQVIREVIPVVPTRYRASDATGATETMVLDPAEPQTAPAARETSRLAQPRRRVRWAAVALSSIVMLVVGFGVITGVEAVLGRPLSAIGGDGSGTTLSHIVHHSNGGGSSPTPSNGGQSDSPTQAPTTGPTDGSTTGTPTTDQPTQTEPTPTDPTPTEPTGTGPTAPQPTGVDGATAAP